MNSSQLLANKERKLVSPRLALERLFLFKIIIGLKNGKTRYSISSKNEDYLSLSFNCCFENYISTRIRCPICINVNGGNKSHVFLNCKSCATHIVKDEHDISKSTISIDSALAIIENHSLHLQLKIMGDKI